jgi:multidrug efflux pump subunit AcrB
MVIVRVVGEDEERALVRLNQKLQANFDRIPPGASPPIVKPRSIDDVPIAAVTLWGNGYEDDVLRSLAAQLREALAEVPDVSEVTLLGDARAIGDRWIRQGWLPPRSIPAVVAGLKPPHEQPAPGPSRPVA